MKVLKKIMLKVLFVGIIVSPSAAIASYKSEIIDSCSAYQAGIDDEHINACKLYIDGFIDASLLTDMGAVMPKEMLNDKTSAKSAYLERAYQTRLLSTASMIKGEDVHQFCIPLEYDRKKIASTLAKSIDINKLADQSLNEVLFATLVINFPCKQ